MHILPKLDKTNKCSGILGDGKEVLPISHKNYFILSRKKVQGYVMITSLQTKVQRESVGW